MFNFKVKSLATKLILVTGCAITTVLVASNSFLISQTSDRVHSLTMDQANTEARAIANVIAADVGELGSAARSMAGIIGRAHRAKSMDRPASSTSSRPMSSRMLSLSEVGSVSSWAFSTDRPPRSPTGSISAPMQQVHLPLLVEDPERRHPVFDLQERLCGGWYSLAAKSGKGAITQPYLAEGTEVPTTMTSLAYPVMSDGKMIGVAGSISRWQLCRRSCRRCILSKPAV